MIPAPAPSHEAIVQQLSYYLSPQNLESDEFFRGQVESHPERFIKISLFLNCNKLKKMGIKREEEIVEAVINRDDFEVSPDRKLLKKKDQDHLPDFKPKKRVKSAEGDEVNPADDKPQHKEPAANPYANLEPTIFILTLPAEQTVPFRYIQEALLKTHNIFSPYVRFNKNQGNFALDTKVATPENIEKLEKEGLKVGEAHLQITKAAGEPLKEFWDKHGHHYNTIIATLKKDFEKKIKLERRSSVQRSKKIEPFTFCGQKYDDINKLKSLFKNLLYRSPNNVALNQHDAALIKELLSHHERGEQKLKGFKHFVVDVHPTHVDTRCFFAVKEDGAREDFSMVKCLNNIEDKNAVK